MKEGKAQERALALLALATNEERNADSEAGAQTNACPGPEEIAAMAEGRLSWERRHRLMRHLAACSDCYRLWLTVARQPASKRRLGLAFPWPWPHLSWKTLSYAGGALAAVAACLAVFLHPPSGPIHYQEKPPPPAPASVSLTPADTGAQPRQSPKGIASLNQPQSKPKPTSEQGQHVPPMADSGAIPSTVDNVAKGEGSVLKRNDAEEGERAKEAAKKRENSSGIIADVAGGQVETGQFAAQSAAMPAPAVKPAEKPNTIRLGAVEVRRSSNQLTVWYGDLREMCRQSHFVPDQWTSLYARGADILEALPEEAQNAETDRLWLILGQMEGLTAERRQSFCSWSSKELARKLEKRKQTRR